MPPMKTAPQDHDLQKFSVPIKQDKKDDWKPTVLCLESKMEKNSIKFWFALSTTPIGSRDVLRIYTQEGTLASLVATV